MKKKAVWFSKAPYQVVEVDGGAEGRKGPWEDIARDRARFMHRIHVMEEQLSLILSKKYDHETSLASMQATDTEAPMQAADAEERGTNQEREETGQ